MHWACAVVVAVALAETTWTPVADASSAKALQRIDPALFAQAKSHPTTLFDVIVQGAPDRKHVDAREKARSVDRAGKAVQEAGGSPRRALGIIGGASAKVRGSGLITLANDDDVAYIFADAALNAKFDPQAGASLVTGAGTLTVKAPATWSQYGVTGRGIAVAVIDSGIYAHRDLAGRIVAAIDFTSASPTVSATPLGDPGGHGTHVAGLIAGDGTASDGAYTGVAPGANLVDVRVINASGASNVSTVLAGLQWVLSNRARYNIRVANLSLGTPEQTSYTLSPLSAAVEVLQYAGVSVVVSAGNSGPGAGTITAPGDDPFVITVGAADDNRTSTLADDSVAAFSSAGPTRYDSLAKPDIVAPGRRMVSLRSPGSALDALLPDRQVTASGSPTAEYFTLSGTSMAAPMVAGAVALLLERDPTLTPREVKQRLLSTAAPLSFGSRYTRGAGLLDTLAAVASTDHGGWKDRSRVSDGFAQMVLPLIYGTTLTWEDATFNGGVDSKGRPWTQLTWSDITWDNLTWDAISWNDITWEGITWDSVTQQDITWETTFDPLSSSGPGWGPLD